MAKNIGVKSAHVCPCGQQHFLIPVPSQAREKDRRDLEHFKGRNDGLKKRILELESQVTSHQIERDKWMSTLVASVQLRSP